MQYQLTEEQTAIRDMAERFGVVNIPNGVWIDEQGIVVRPAEPAPAPRREDRAGLGGAMELPDRMMEIFTEAQKIQSDPDAYESALRDWVANGSSSRFALSPEAVIERSRPRDRHRAEGEAHFELASHLEVKGSRRHDAHPHRRQSLGSVIRAARF